MRAPLPPTPRDKVYDLYWIFAARRQAAFQNRIAGREWPWSNDPIIQTYKFCNVYRAADRVSQYLIKNVAYSGDAATSSDRAFQIVAFRTFSKIETWQNVSRLLGHAPVIEDLESGAFARALAKTKLECGGLYTGAFILCATKAFGYDEKHLNHVALFKHMFLHAGAGQRIENAKSLEEVVRLLESFPLTGPFMSYQIAIDLNYSSLIDFDENDYTQAGPGALRGINKAFSDTGTYSPSDVIKWMTERQHAELKRLDLDFTGLWGRPLHAIDCQNLFCEMDKYCREAAPHLISNRTRIKSRFSPSLSPQQFFFPPKWGINHLLPPEAAFGGARQLEMFSRHDLSATHAA